MAKDPAFESIKFFKFDVDAAVRFADRVECFRLVAHCSAASFRPLGEQEDLAALLNIEAMPTFTFFFNGAKVDELTVRGASEDKIKASLAALAAK